MLNAPTVVKVGGNQVEDARWVAELATRLVALGPPVVVVHGGGREVTRVQRLLGAEPSWQAGLRHTPPEAVDAVRMVLSGLVNKRLVAALLGAGLDAVGISGEDGGLLRARLAAAGTLGRTGEVESVRAELLERWMETEITPVVSPVSRGPDGEPLNVNADAAAAAIASALGARELCFVSDVAAVLRGNVRLADLGTDEVEDMIVAGTAADGMVPKLRAAAAAAASVPRVRIGALDLLTVATAGTRLFASMPEGIAP
ncbi:MAG: acetylglutamate kinase [Longimicrobiaceae bacterium]